MKEFLKKEENRNNLYFYKEYALIELEMDRFTNCMNILEYAIQCQETCPSAITDVYERAALFHIYRTFIETLLDNRTYHQSHNDWILKIFGKMVPDKSENQDSLERYLHSYVEKFLENPPAENMKDTFFLSNLECDAIVCYAYFLYVKYNHIKTVIDTLKKCIDHSADHPCLQVIIELIS